MMIESWHQLFVWFSRYNFTPLTYNLPSEYSIFCEEFKKVNSLADSKQLWIMKPVINQWERGEIAISYLLCIGLIVQTTASRVLIVYLWEYARLLDFANHIDWFSFCSADWKSVGKRYLPLQEYQRNWFLEKHISLWSWQPTGNNHK